MKSKRPEMKWDEMYGKGGEAAPELPRRTTNIYSRDEEHIGSLVSTACSYAVKARDDIFIDWYPTEIENQPLLNPPEERKLFPGDPLYDSWWHNYVFWRHSQTFRATDIQYVLSTDVTDAKYFFVKAYSLPSYRDPTVSKLNEIDVWKRVQEAFENDVETISEWVITRWVVVKRPRSKKAVMEFKEVTKPRLKFYNPDVLGNSVFNWVRQTTGAEDEIDQRQLNKLRRWKAAKVLSEKDKAIIEWIERILDGDASIQSAADELGVSLSALRQRMSTFLNRSPEDVDTLWRRAVANSMRGNGVLQPGLYAMAQFAQAKPFVYLIVPWETMTGDPEIDSELVCNGIMAAAARILERRIRNKRISRAKAKKLFDETDALLYRFPLRSLPLTPNISST